MYSRGSSSRVRRAMRGGACFSNQIATGGCRSYLIGCEETCAAALIDPEISQLDRYLALAAHHGFASAT